jgi:nicotinamide-nucleotide amidase
MRSEASLDRHGLERVKELMMRHGLSLSVAESLTTGNIQAKIGSVSGASNFFEGGVTAYNVDQKVSLLGINRAHAEQVNCVSQLVAREMAEGVCRRFGTDIGLATTGYAEPSPEAEFGEPYAYYAIWRRQGDAGRVVREGLIKEPGAGRVDVQHKVTDRALLDLLQYLSSL